MSGSIIQKIDEINTELKHLEIQFNTLRNIETNAINNAATQLIISQSQIQPETKDRQHCLNTVKIINNILLHPHETDSISLYNYQKKYLPQNLITNNKFYATNCDEFTKTIDTYNSSDLIDIVVNEDIKNGSDTNIYVKIKVDDKLRIKLL